MSQPVNRTAARVLSLVMVVLCMVAAGVGVRLSQEEKPYSLGDFSQVSLDETQEEFQRSQSNEDLVTLLKVLCWQAVEGNNPEAEEMIAQYGTLLFDRARAGEADLSEVGDDENMLELLRLIRSFGAE